MKTSTFATIAAGLALAAGQASAVTLTFDTLAEGSVLSNQYTAQGATFSASPLSGASGSGSTAGIWASVTDMTVTSSTSGDVGGLGSPSLVSGNLLHAFGNVYTTSPTPGWLGEDGDPNFQVAFAVTVNTVSATFAGVATPAATRMFVYSGATLLTTLAGTTGGQFTLSYTTALNISKIIIAPGTYDDWVGVDNITYSAAAVPEISTYAMLALGLGFIAVKRRRAA